jgi:hypothetical protein
MEAQGPRNVRGLMLGACYKPVTNFTASLEYQSFDLFDPKDGWYGGGSTINKWPGGSFVDPTGKSGRHAGEQFQLVLNWTIDKRSAMQLGGAIFSPGTFVKNVEGGSASRQKWAYLMFNFKL